MNKSEKLSEFEWNWLPVEDKEIIERLDRIEKQVNKLLKEKRK